MSEKILSDDELDSLRERKKRELLSQSIKKELDEKKKQETIRTEQERQIRATMIVNKVLQPDAILYMDWLTKTNPAVAQTIKDSIILLLHRKMLNKSISKIDIMRMERQLTGQDSQIKVKKRGRDISNLDEKIKEDKEMNNHS